MKEITYYLDNAATTKMDEEVFKNSAKFLCEEFFNPSAVYSPSVEVKRIILKSRQKILDALGVDDGDLIFTGSATEANNTVIFSQKNKADKRYLFGAGEHPSVMECAKELSKRGFNVQFIPLASNGQIDMEKYKELIEGGDIAFVSVQHVSNETGAINPIAKMVKLARKYNKDVLFHSDGVQAFMKFKYSLLQLDVDYYTISAHKIYGPKGVGCLYVKKGVKINPYIFGGGQENALRSGTENVFGIVAFGNCVEKLTPEIDSNWNRVQEMRKSLLEELENLGVNYIVHGDETGVPHTMNICLSKNVRGETLVHALEKRNVFVSTGSACSATKHFNSTLEAMGIPNDEILSSIRVSISPYMEFDAKVIANIINEELRKVEGRSYE